MQCVTVVLLVVATLIITWSTTNASESCSDSSDLSVKSKPGRCPVLPLFLSRILCIASDDECTCDADCDNNLKCCSNGCIRTCQKPVVTCPVRLCKKSCPFGYVYDDNECQLCECYDPCAEHDCPPGQVCKASLVQCFRHPCIPPSMGHCVPTTKPGQCPAAPDNLTGVVCKPHNECEIDADCDSNLKCCSNGCRLTCQKPVECPPVRCEISCQYGFAWDENNCPVCKCYHNPCAATLCPVGTVCEPVMVNCLVAPCIPPSIGTCVPTKPGQCPQVNRDTHGICVEQCSNDGDCNDDLKCCSNGCGHTCQKPVCKDQGPCNIRCAYGLKYDSNGCQLCECQENPCNLVDCGSGKICIPVAIDCPVSVPCTPRFEAKCVCPE